MKSRSRKKKVIPGKGAAYASYFWNCNRRPVSSVGRAPDCCEGGRRFKSWPDQNSGSLNDWGESAAFVMTSANGSTFKSSRINRRPRLTVLVGDVKEPTHGSMSPVWWLITYSDLGVPVYHAVLSHNIANCVEQSGKVPAKSVVKRIWLYPYRKMRYINIKHFHFHCELQSLAYS